MIPFMFRDIVSVDAERHGALRLDRATGFDYAATINAVPVGLAEAMAVAADYPLVFAGSGTPTLTAVLGYRDGENLCVDPSGAWRLGSYVPAYLRTYPFIFVEVPDSDRMVLAVDPTASCLKQDTGAPLFEDGQPSDALKDVMRLCAELRDAIRHAGEFCAALDDAGLLVEHQAVLNFARGGAARLEGFRVIDPAKFDALDDARFLDWRKRGWLTAAYAHFHSVGRWSRIIEMAAERLDPPA